MAEEEEPPSGRGFSGVGTTMLSPQNDIRRMVLLPNRSLGEIAVCNPAVYDGGMIYRAREIWKNKYGERSVVKKDGEIIMSPEYEFEKDGVEDARVSKKWKDGLHRIPYVAFNEKKGARIALATTKDFKDIKKHGIIGPQIKLSEAIHLAGGPNTYYGDYFARLLADLRKTNPRADPFALDKDPAIVYSKGAGSLIFIHRYGDSMQATPFSSVKELQNPDFWRHKVSESELEQDTILRPEECWASEKVGLGGTPITVTDDNGLERVIGHVHGVRKVDGENGTFFIYNSTIAEFDPETYHITSILRDPVLNPTGKVLFERDGDRFIKKYVNFATGMRVVGDTIEHFSGVGDFGIEVRTTDKGWVLDNLSHPHNNRENWGSVDEMVELEAA